MRTQRGGIKDFSCLNLVSPAGDLMLEYEFKPTCDLFDFCSFQLINSGTTEKFLNMGVFEYTVHAMTDLNKRNKNYRGQITSFVTVLNGKPTPNATVRTTASAEARQVKINEIKTKGGLLIKSDNLTFREGTLPSMEVLSGMNEGDLALYSILMLEVAMKTSDYGTYFPLLSKCNAFLMKKLIPKKWNIPATYMVQLNSAIDTKQWTTVFGLIMASTQRSRVMHIFHSTEGTPPNVLIYDIQNSEYFNQLNNEIIGVADITNYLLVNDAICDSLAGIDMLLIKSFKDYTIDYQIASDGVEKKEAKNLRREARERNRKKPDQE
jgi:hypothetical protein